MKQRTIHEQQSRPFPDRVEAGRQLAKHLESYRDTHPLILGIPRGGVPVAAEVARYLGAELDIVVARKLGAPHAPELAIGATTANGGLILDEDAIAMLHVPAAYLDMVVTTEGAEARRREAFLRGQPKIPIAGRTVILVDDGLATGATMRAAVRAVRKEHPAKLVVAVPVGSRSACDAVRAEVDDLICPWQPEPLFAIGLYYTSFDPTEDSEVQRLLQEALKRGTETEVRTS